MAAVLNLQFPTLQKKDFLSGKLIIKVTQVIVKVHHALKEM